MLRTSLLALILALLPGVAVAKCGRVTIGAMNWNSARVIANVEKFILIEGFGCRAETVATTSVPGVTSHVEKGTPDIISEMWINSVQELYEKGVRDGRIVNAGKILSDGGVEAWWLPKYLADQHPNIRTVEDLKRNWKLFEDPENPGKGRFYNCPTGWVCRIVNDNLFAAYGLGDKFVNYDPGSADGLKASIARAFAQKKPWVGYYWAPTAVLGRYPMVPLKLGAYTKAGYECNQRKNCEKPHAGSYPPAEIFATTTTKFRDENPEAFAFIANISITNKVMNDVLAWGDQHQAKGPEMAGYFLKTYPDVWKQWLSDDVAGKVAAALKR